MNDGWNTVPRGDGSNLIRGRICRFVQGEYRLDKVLWNPAASAFIVTGVVSLWTKFTDGRPEHIITQPGTEHPERDQLPDQDESLWALDRFTDRPADPWKDSRHVFLVETPSANSITFITDSAGGRSAVGNLRGAITNMRTAHPGAVPVIKLGVTSMRTKYGDKPRPDLVVIDWKLPDQAAAPALAAPPLQPTLVLPAVPSLRDDMDDELPF